MKALLGIVVLATGIAFGQLPGSISGVVTESSSHLPIAGATVFITLDSDRWRTQTDLSGHYTLRDVPAGEYIVMAQPIGKKGQSESRAVELAGGEDLAKVDFKLDVSVPVTGVVTDDDKKPVAGAVVWVINREYQFGELRYLLGGEVTTNAAGEYTLPLRSVTPGRGFLLYATTEPQHYPNPISDASADPDARPPALLPMYYPNSPDVHGAQVITIRAGEVREHIDFVLRRVPSYCLSATLLANGSPAVIPYWLRNQNIRNSAEIIETFPSSKSTTDGRIRICDLHPGEYEISAAPPGLLGHAKVMITNRDVDKIVVETAPGIAIKGKASWVGESRREGFEGVFLRIESPGEMQMGLAKIGADGRITSQEMHIGEFEVEVMHVPKGCYVKDITYGGRSASRGAFQPDARSELEVILGHDAGFVSAKVADSEGKPIPAVTVVIFPASATTEAEIADSMISGTTDSSGVFTSKELAPGKYYVMACSLKIARSPEVIGKLFAARSRFDVHDLAANSAIQVTLDFLNLD